VRSGDTIEIVREPDRREFLKYVLPVPFAYTLSKRSYLFHFLNTRVYQRLRGTRMREMERADVARTESARDEVLVGMLGRMAALLARHDVRLALVLIPTREQAQQRDAPVLLPVVDFCRRQGIACLSLLDRFGNERDAARSYFPIDIHWTKAGHRLAAEAISLFLGDEGWESRRLSSLATPTSEDVHESCRLGGRFQRALAIEELKPNPS
jgi:hypothetical protein